MRWRSNVKQPKIPVYLPKYREDVGVCEHIEREFHGDEDVKEAPELAQVLFEQQFKNLLVLLSDDNLYRLYLLCSQCRSESFEEFYWDIYPRIIDSSMKPRSHYDDVVKWFGTKDVETQSLNQLLRTHALGNTPKVGDHVHLCDHCRKGNVIFVIQTEDDDSVLEALAEGEDLSQPTHLILCPDCVADFDPDTLYAEITPVNWSQRDKMWLGRCNAIYDTASSFFNRLFEELEEAAEDLEEYKYEGPTVGEPILLCDHLKKSHVVDRSSVEYINEDESPYLLSKKRKLKITWLAACQRCIERTDSALQIVKNKCRKKRLYHWTEVDQVKMSIEEIGDEFVFSDGITVEPLAQAICEIFERPDWFFDTNSIAWVLARDWAPSFFDVDIMPASQITEEELRKAHHSGEMWQTRQEKHPTTREEFSIRENSAIIIDDYSYGISISIPYEINKLSQKQLDILETEAKEIENHLDEIAHSANGAKYQIVTSPRHGIREYFYLFKHKHEAEMMDDILDEDDFDVELFDLTED